VKICFIEPPAETPAIASTFRAAAQKSCRVLFNRPRQGLTLPERRSVNFSMTSHQTKRAALSLKRSAGK